jgi:hypothetical protein
MISHATPTLFDIHFPASSAPGVAPYSARGLTGTLTPIDAANGSSLVARTVNGGLVDISAPQMRKYKLEVSGTDQESPALDGVWVGMVVTVNSFVELAYLTAGGSPERTPVSGSSRTEGAYTFYMPTFSMMVVEKQQGFEEWNAHSPWQITLEEI